MKIGILVDGQAEFTAMPKVLPRIETPHKILDPLFAPIQPLAPIGQIVHALKARLHILANRGVHKVVVLIDFETRNSCIGEWAFTLETAIRNRYSNMGIAEFNVVIKDTKFENWLISDPKVFLNMRKRFKIPVKDAERFVLNNADSMDALSLLKKMSVGNCYDKISDAQRICSEAHPMRMAKNSRSFRRFLRIVGVPEYEAQSKHP